MCIRDDSSNRIKRPEDYAPRGPIPDPGLLASLRRGTCYIYYKYHVCDKHVRFVVADANAEAELRWHLPPCATSAHVF